MKNLKVGGFLNLFNLSIDKEIKKIPYKAWISHFFILSLFIFSRMIEYPVPRWIFWAALINIHYTFLKKMFLKNANIEENNNLNSNGYYSYLDPWNFLKVISNIKEIFKAYAITYYILFIISIFFVLFLMPISYFIIRVLYLCIFFFNKSRDLVVNNLLSHLPDNKVYNISEAKIPIITGTYTFFFFKLNTFQKFILHTCFFSISIIPIYKIFCYYMNRFGFLIARFWVERDGMILPFTNPIVNEKQLKNWKIINLFLVLLSFIVYPLLFFSKYYELYEIFNEESIEKTQYISNEVFVVTNVKENLDIDVLLSVYLSIFISILFFWLYLKCLIYAKYTKKACIKSSDPKELFK